MKHIKEFRSCFQEVIPMIYSQRKAIYNFIKKADERKGKGMKTKKNKKNNTYKNNKKE